MRMPCHGIAVFSNGWHGSLIFVHGVPVAKIVFVESLFWNWFLYRIFLLLPKQLSHLFNFIFNGPCLLLDFFGNLEYIESLCWIVHYTYLFRIVNSRSYYWRSIRWSTLVLHFRCVLIHFWIFSFLCCLEIIVGTNNAECF